MDMDIDYGRVMDIDVVIGYFYCSWVMVVL
jgi:hypothetical protein